MNAQNIYVGMRYVPKYMGTWSSEVEYEPLSVVLGTDGSGYTSKKPVPAGTPTSNTDYWALTGSGNSVIDGLKDQINSLETNVNNKLEAFEGKMWWSNALDLGFKNDGTTLNDTAFAKLTGKTGYIVFPKGTYKISANAVCPLTAIIMPGAVFDCDIKYPSLGRRRYIDFENGIITGKQKIFDGFIMPRFKANNYFPLCFEWWGAESSNAEINQQVLDFILFTEKNNVNTLELYFKDNNYSFKPLVAKESSANTIRINNLKIKQQISINSLGNEGLQVPPGYYENVTFNTNYFFSFISKVEDCTIHFKNCTINSLRIGSRNTYKVKYENSILNCIQFGKEGETNYIALANNVEMNDCTIKLNTNNPITTNEMRIIDFLSGSMQSSNYSFNNLNIIRDGSNMIQNATLFYIGYNNLNIRANNIIAYVGTLSKVIHNTSNYGNIVINGLKIYATLKSLIDSQSGNSNITVSNADVSFTQNETNNDSFISCRTLSKSNINLLNINVDCKNSQIGPNILANEQAKIFCENLTIYNNDTIKGITANGGTYIKTPFTMITGNVKGFDIVYNGTPYTVYPEIEGGGGEVPELENIKQQIENLQTGVSENVHNIQRNRDNITALTQQDYPIDWRIQNEFMTFKFKDGIQIVTFNLPVNNIGLNTQFGSMYRNTANIFGKTQYPYPTPFIENPAIQATFNTTTGTGAFIISDIDTAELKTHVPLPQLVAPNQRTVTGYITYTVIGRYK